jgi:hypothetical protein
MRKIFMCVAGVALVAAGCSDDPVVPPTATVTSVSVSGASGSVTVGGTVQFSATANLSNNTTQNVSSTAAWSSTNAGVATVSNTGLATAVGPGTTEIRASHQNVSGGAQLQVNPAGPTVTAAFVVQSIGDNQIDVCRIDGGDFKCSFIGTASSSTAGPITTWIWQFFVGPFQSQVIQDSDPFLDPGSTCGFFNTPTRPAPTGAGFTQMIVDLQVRDIAGNLSGVTRNANVRLFPQQNCGFTF